MMKVSREEIDQIAALAKLDFEADVKTQMANDLKQILQYVKQLDKLITDPLPGRSQTARTSGLREDQPKPGLTQREALKNAPASNLGYFSVPKVIS